MAECDGPVGHEAAVADGMRPFACSSAMLAPAPRAPFSCRRLASPPGAERGTHFAP